MNKYPKIEYLEQVMRDGLQIEDARIPVEAKLRLLNAIGDTGINYIEVGSFVSPKWTPQMANIDEFMQRFVPKPGIKYVALTMNERGMERAHQYSPPLTIKEEYPYLRYWLCDVFARRNINRSQEQLLAAWPGTVQRAKDREATEVGLALGTPWGSNWVGEFSLEDQMRMLEQEHQTWDEAGFSVTRFSVADPMSWGMPHKVEETITAVKERWPEIRHFHLHLHDARGLALTNIYAAMRALDPDDTLLVEGTIGGIGGCPYCGNGRAAGMVPTEDLMHMLQGMGIDMGVDIDKLIDCAWMLEEMIGRPAPGHVLKAGPCPRTKDRWYPMDLPFIETMEQARHFKLGPRIYEGGLRPWSEPIKSQMRPEG
jgi:hydroxymethylglutaryl-CoA lyase